MTKDFQLGALLSLSTGVLVAPFGDVHELLDFMTGDQLFTHQIPRAGDACLPALLEQHPDLPTEIPAGVNLNSKQACREYVTGIAVELGESRTITPLASWEKRNPMVELAEIAGTRPVIGVNA